MLKTLAGRLTLAIAWLTVLAGAFQVIAPGLVLGVLNAEVSAASSHFFAIVGMFMVLFGGLMVQSMRLPAGSARLPLLWCALQKFGASLAVGLGVYNEVFSCLALLVAVFDGLSGGVILYYRRGLE